MSNISVTTNQSIIDVTNTSGITVTTPEGQTIAVTVPNTSVNVTTTTDDITVLTNGTIIYESGVKSVNGDTGPAVVLDTDDINEGATNKYFTQTRARQSLSAGTGISYDSNTGIITNISINTDTTYTQNAGTATGGANLNLVGSDGSTDTVKFASGTGITVSRTDADTITITNTVPDTNTTYTVDATTTTGGANLNLVGSDATTDSVAYLGSGATTVTRTDANTITIASTDTNTTYTQNAGTATGGANLNLVGSDSTTDAVKFASGTNVTVSRTDDSTITISSIDTNTTYAIASNSTTGGANLTLSGSDSSTDNVAYKGAGATTVTSTDANTITITSTDTNTTYTQNASTTTGGANLNLVGSDSTTDAVKFAGSGATTITRTDADTITVSSTDTNTTYTQNVSSTTGGANLNLVGSDSTTDTVKFANGTGVTVTRTDADTATISIGQDVATTADVIFNDVNVTAGLNADKTVAGGGKVSTTGDILVNINGATNNTQLPTAAFFDNTTVNRRGMVVVREFGQNTGTLASNATVGTGNIVLEGTRANGGVTNNSTGNNNIIGRVDFGGFDGTRWTSETALIGGSAALQATSQEIFASSTITITGSISATTLTVTATTGYIYPGMILSGTNILFGTVINSMGSNTNGGAGTYTVSRSHSATGSQSITAVGTTNSGTSLRLTSQPSGVKFTPTTTATWSSRQNWLNQTWFPPTTATINTVTVNNAPGNNINIGISDSGDITTIGSTDNVIYKGRGLTNVIFQGASFLHTGVTDYDAQFSGYIATNTLTVTSWASGFISTGSLLTATGIQPATFITAQLTSALAASATTTATGTSGTATITVASATGISVGQLVIASGIPSSTFVSTISGTTVTLTANLTAPLSATAINFYTAGRTGTYTVSTTFATAGQTIGSAGSPIAFAATADNNGLRSSNKWNSYTSRKSMLSGRQAPLKNTDSIYAFNQFATSDTGFAGFTQTQTGSLTWTAAEDFSPNAVGSEVKLQTANIGTTTLGNRFIATSANATISSNQLTLTDSSSVNLVGTNITYNRVYGQWQYDATITPAGANTAYAFPFQGGSAVIDFANIASTTNTSRIRPNAVGFFNLQFSVQCQNTDNAADHTAYVWWRKNGVDIPGSMGRVYVTKQHQTIAAWNNIVQTTASTDYFELMYAVDDVQLIFPYFASTAFGPATASIFVSLVPLGA